jgi:hypothetical protein
MIELSGARLLRVRLNEMQCQLFYYPPMPEPTSPLGAQARRERTENARLDNFVDGAFAFAVTLLSLLLVFFALIFVFPLHLVYASFFSAITGGWLSPYFALLSVGLVSALIALLAFATGIGWLIAVAGFSYASLGFTGGIAKGYRARIEQGQVP